MFLRHICAYQAAGSYARRGPCTMKRLSVKNESDAKGLRAYTPFIVRAGRVGYVRAFNPRSIKITETSKTCINREAIGRVDTDLAGTLGVGDEADRHVARGKRF